MFRSYKAAIALSLPADTDVADIDWDALFKIARQIPSDVPNVR
jgi:hypothetical protein